MRLFFLLLVLFALVASQARATDVHRCTGVDGSAIFTDKKCEDIGAVVRAEPASTITGTRGTQRTGQLGRRGCARSADELRRGLQAALDDGNVNQLAAFYHWPGVSGAESEGILKRLQSIVDRQPVSVRLIRVRQPIDADGYTTVASVQSDDASAVEFVQSRFDDDPASLRSAVSVTHYLGCLWIHF